MNHALASLWRKWTSRTGVDWPAYKLLFKDTIAPAIGLAANQATPWSNVFGTLGFLVPMISIISRPSPPRAEFLRIWFMNIVGTCISAAVTALALFCVIKAREQSDDPVKNTPYNATASTVAAIWLIAQTYVISAVRYNYPETVWAASICLIFSNYGMVYAVQFQTMNAAYLFLQQLFLAHLVGLGMSAGVSLLIFPTSSREVYFSTALACIRETQSALRTNVKVMEHATRSADKFISSELDTARKQHAMRLKSFHMKLAAQVQSARNEFALGILAPADLSTLHQLLEDVLTPLIGLCRVADVMDNALNESKNSAKTPSDPLGPYRELLKFVVEPFSQSCVACDTALEVCAKSIGLKVGRSPINEACQDNESFNSQLEHQMRLLVACKSDLREPWYAIHSHSNVSSELDTSVPREEFSLEAVNHSRISLYMVLYNELLLWSICQRIHALVAWGEEMQSSEASGRKQRLQVPQWLSVTTLSPTITRWMDTSDHLWPRESPRKRGYNSGPAHWSFIFGPLQSCARFFASPASGFGLRVVCATMSIAIVTYLPSSQAFYIKQDLVWSQYAVSLAMLGSEGLSIRALAFRLAATIIAVCLAWASWYIVVGTPAGVLVMYWLSMHFPMYIITLRPRYSTIGTVSSFALTTILGHELPPNKKPQSTLVLGAIRLAAVAGGCLLATFWTLFPFPASDQDGARQSLGSCLSSLAEYHTGFRAILRTRLKEGRTQESLSARNRQLQTLHSQLFASCNSGLESLRTQLRFLKWNIHTERFAHPQYKSACDSIDAMMANMQLATFASSIFTDFIHNVRSPLSATLSSPSNSSPTELSQSSPPSHWFLDFNNLLDDSQNNGLSVAALLGLLSHSIRHEAPLPLNLNPPGFSHIVDVHESQRFGHQIESIGDPGSATFALMAIGMRGFRRDLKQLFETIKEMVGEYDFVDCFSLDPE